MAALVASLLIRLTDRSADWTAGTAEATGKPGAVLAGATISIVITHAVAAVAGYVLGQYLTPNPLRLMLAVMLFLAAAGAVWPGKPKEPATKRPLLATLARLIPDGINGRGEYVVFALAAGGTAALAAIGGAIGSLVILTAVALMGEQLWRPLPHRAIGIVGGLLLAATAAWLGLSAIRLI